MACSEGVLGSLLREEETCDSALGGAVQVIQPRRGFRFSVDAVLLARFASEGRVERALDLCSGCGIVALCLKALGGAERVLGVDLQDAMVDRATRGARLGGVSESVRFKRHDLRHDADLLVDGSRFDLVVSNPPYQRYGEGRLSRDPMTALAKAELTCSLADVLDTAARVLAAHGALCLVYPVKRLVQVMTEVGTRGLNPHTLWLVHPREGQAASLFLLRCERGYRGDLRIRSPLFLHGEQGEKYAPEALRLLGPP